MTKNAKFKKKADTPYSEISRMDALLYGRRKCPVRDLQYLSWNDMIERQINRAEKHALWSRDSES